MMKAVHILGKLLVAILILIAIQDYEIQAGANDLHLCSLLTASEIHEIVAVTVDQGTEDKMGDLYQCSWAPHEENGLSPMLSYEPGGATAKDSCTARFSGEKKLGRKMEEISGIGNRAWWSFHSKDQSTSNGGLTVCGPKGVLRVSLQGQSEELKMKSMTEALARKAYSRLAKP